jgi:hypothetical protein
VAERRLFALVIALASLLVTPIAQARPGDCHPVRAVFYESSDWARLVAGLAADASPCADYYVTVPALAADKTQFVQNRASQVRSYGSNFHALAEINYSAWESWVGSTGHSWYQAGQEARRRMAAAGFDVNAGDTWAVNEFTSAVRSNAASERANVRTLVRGLYDGDGGSGVKGVVFVVGVGQNGVSFPEYKATLESWLQDTDFWNDMSSYVSGFYQEVYGDVRNYAVSGVDPTTRAALLNGFLQHLLTLVEAPNAPSSVAAAKTFLTSAYGPLANASWGWASSYGWTQVTPDVMADYVSAQTYAMRLTGETNIGFAWNPLNSTSLSADDYAAGIAGVLARLAGSIHETDSADPSVACEATGCGAVLDGAATAPGWSTFSSWTPTTATFTTPPVSMSRGMPSDPLSLQLQTGGIRTSLPFDAVVTLTSSSPTGAFSTSAAGPWTPTLTLTLAAGTSSATFYVRDTTAGQPLLTSNLGGQTATQVATVVAPNLPAPPPPPPSASVTSLAYTPLHDHLHVGLRVVDSSGQPLQGSVRLGLFFGNSPIASAALRTRSDGSIGVTIHPHLQLGCYTARVEAVTVTGHLWDSVTPAANYCVRTVPLHVTAIAFAKYGGRLHVGLRVVDSDGRPIRARVSLVVRRHGLNVATAAGTAGANGWLSTTLRPKLGKGEACFAARIVAAAAAGHKWDGQNSSKFGCVRSK